MATKTIEPFALIKERFTLANVNTRKENHGDEIRKGYDLKFTGKMHNSVLLKFHRELRDAFYMTSKQADIEGDQKPVLRFPMLGDLSYDLEIPRTLLRIHDIDSEEHDFVMGGGKTNAFKFTLMEGGSVDVSFRVQFSNPDEEEMLKVMRVEFQSVQISLECAEMEEKPDNFQQVDLITQTPHSAARAEAESLFDKPATDLALATDADAGSIPEPEQVETGPVSIVMPIKSKRVTKAPAEAAPAEPLISPAKAKRVSRKSIAEVE